MAIDETKVCTSIPNSLVIVTLISKFLHFFQQNDYVQSDQKAFDYLEKAVDQVYYSLEDFKYFLLSVIALMDISMF